MPLRSTKPHILAIDDDEVARESAQVLLSRWGYRVSLAEAGEKGLHLLRQDPPDLILVDLQMPGISGLEVLAGAREFDPAIVCVMVTGHATLQSAVDAMKQGAYDFLPKPFSPNELKHVVARGLERRFLELEFKELREEKARMEANFVTLVSHQMRSPLAAVRQLMEVVVTESLGPMPPAYREMVGRAVSRLDDLLHSLNAWLAMSRLAESGIAERRQPTGLKGLMAELAQRAAVDAEAAGQTLAVEEDPAGDVEISVDRETLLEALYNLASNAVKYNRAGGQVTLASRVGPFQVDITVSDQGPGIPEAEQPFIFDDFFRSKSPELKGKPGTGLGLAIARRVVKAHRGEITVQSAPGRGAIFTASLPR
ncbi:MAG: hybrid sensor histidine kinase/response regulator [Pseudomonadota bacterium]